MLKHWVMVPAFFICGCDFPFECISRNGSIDWSMSHLGEMWRKKKVVWPLTSARRADQETYLIAFSAFTHVQGRYLKWKKVTGYLKKQSKHVLMYSASQCRVTITYSSSVCVCVCVNACFLHSLHMDRESSMYRIDLVGCFLVLFTITI